MSDTKKTAELYLNQLMNSDDIKGRLILARDVTIKTEKVCTILWNEIPEAFGCGETMCSCDEDDEDFRVEIIEEAREKISELSDGITIALVAYEELEKIMERYEKEDKRIEEENGE